jgi:cell shape-determining protein MreC
MVSETTIHQLNQVINQNISLKTNLLLIKSKDKVQVSKEILKKSKKNLNMKENTWSYRKLGSSVIKIYNLTKSLEKRQISRLEAVLNKIR